LNDYRAYLTLFDTNSEGGWNFHILLALQRGSDGDGEKTILGGCACEYYPLSNSGLLTYIAMDPNHRSKGISGHIIQQVLNALNEDSRKAGNKGLSALFLETNDDTKVSAEKDVMDPLVRHKILSRLGFSILECRYVQPALSPDKQKCEDLLLAVHESFLKDDKEKGTKYIDSSIIFSFIHEFFMVLMGEEVLDTDADYLAAKKELTERSRTYARYIVHRAKL